MFCEMWCVCCETWLTLRGCLWQCQDRRIHQGRASCSIQNCENVKSPVACTSRGRSMCRSPLALEGSVTHLMLGRTCVPAVMFVTPLSSDL